MQQAGGAKMHMTMDFWVSPDVPGYQEMRAFYQRMALDPAGRRSRTEPARECRRPWPKSRRRWPA